MISILIPIYNEDVRLLVKTLSHQCQFIDGLDYEIILYDDGSELKYQELNEEVLHLPHIIYKVMPKNLGRAKIRNLLAFQAKGNRLLFIDGDSGILKKYFIKDYLTLKDKIIFGGRVYPPKCSNPDYLLHWRYGTLVESKSAESRKKLPYLSFMSNNFLIDKSIFLDHLFDETIEGYGYEDLAFAERLKGNKIPITHINNEVVHLGIEQNDIYLKKTEKAIHNLYALHKSGMIMETRLIRYYNKNKGLISILPTKKMGSLLKQNLLGKNPNLNYLQLYKLILFNSISR